MTAKIIGTIRKSKAKKVSSAKVGDNSAVKQNEIYAVSVSYTGKQITIMRGKVVVAVEIKEKYIEIMGNRGHEFVFKSTNEAKTVKLWEEVIGCLSMAIQEIKRQRKL